MEITSANAINTAVEGLKKAQSQIEESAQNVAEGSTDPTDIVSLTLAATSFKANAAVIKTENENIKALLDITA
jgi:ubiquinone biosynthesis protein UbiJ